MTTDHEKMMSVGQAEARKYHEAVGRFVLGWAGTEQLLYQVLLRYAGMTEEVGRSMLSGVRAKPLMDNILRVVENTRAAPTRSSDLRFLFAQLGAILHMRDQLVHYGDRSFITYSVNGVLSDSYQLLTNTGRAAKASKAYVYKVSVKTIDAMSDDLSRVTVALKQHLVEGDTQDDFTPWAHSGDASTWLYKSPQPGQKPD